jgi:hypothetical protein
MSGPNYTGRHRPGKPEDGFRVDALGEYEG